MANVDDIQHNRMCCLSDMLVYTSAIETISQDHIATCPMQHDYKRN